MSETLDVALEYVEDLLRNKCFKKPSKFREIKEQLLMHWFHAFYMKIQQSE